MSCGRLRQVRAWLIGQWLHLLGAVPVDGVRGWGEAETQAALDLLGKPKTLRTSSAIVSMFVNLSEIRTMIEAQVEALRAENADCEAENAELRDLHRHGLGLENDATLKLMRRYESAANRQLEKSTKIIKQSQAARPKTAPTPEPTVCETKPIPEPASVAPEPAAASKPTPEPPSEVRGNRRFRRKQQAKVRQEASRSR